MVIFSFILVLIAMLLMGMLLRLSLPHGPTTDKVIAILLLLVSVTLIVIGSL